MKNSDRLEQSLGLFVAGKRLNFSNGVNETVTRNKLASRSNTRVTRDKASPILFHVVKTFEATGVLTLDAFYGKMTPTDVQGSVILRSSLFF